MNKKNLLQIYKNKIFVKLFNKLKAFFYNKRKNKKENQIINNFKEQQSVLLQNNFLESIKVEEFYKDISYEKKEFIKKLEYNPDLLKNFSVDKLEIILKYYLDENDKKRKILRKFTM